MSEHEHEHDHDNDDEIDEEQDAIDAALEMEAQIQISMELRRQNIELLKVAVEVAGLGGQHPPLKPHDMKNAVKGLWDLYSEFYSWIQPDEDEEGVEDDEDEDDDE